LPQAVPNSRILKKCRTSESLVEKRAEAHHPFNEFQQSKTALKEEGAGMILLVTFDFTQTGIVSDVISVTIFRKRDLLGTCDYKNAD
jgi:hypothetical protein